MDARGAADDRPPLVVLATCLGHLGAPPAPSPASNGVSLRQAREDWLRRLETSQKSKSARVAYRVAIDDMLDWADATGRNVLEEATLVDYFGSYRERAQPAEATYYRRFVLLRRVDRDELFDAAGRLEQLAASPVEPAGPDPPAEPADPDAPRSGSDQRRPRRRRRRRRRGRR